MAAAVAQGVVVALVALKYRLQAQIWVNLALHQAERLGK